MEDNEIFYKNLAIAIVERAVIDYITTEKEDELVSIRRFFKSGYYRMLCDIDGIYMIKLCEKKRRRMLNGEKIYIEDDYKRIKERN